MKSEVVNRADLGRVVLELKEVGHLFTWSGSHDRVYDSVHDSAPGQEQWRGANWQAHDPTGIIFYPSMLFSFIAAHPLATLTFTLTTSCLCVLYCRGSSSIIFEPTYPCDKIGPRLASSLER